MKKLRFPKKMPIKKKREYKNSIGKKLTRISICCILITAVATACVAILSGDVRENSILENDTETSIQVLENHITDLKSNIKGNTYQLSQNETLTELLKASAVPDASLLGAVSSSAKFNADYITLLDPTGKIVATTGSGGAKAGTSLSGLKDVKEAMDGKWSNGYLETGADCALSVRASAPVQFAGKTLAIVSAGYDLSRPNILDSLKKTVNCEFTYFLNDVRVSTTIQLHGKEITGTKADADVVNRVIGQKQECIGTKTIENVPFHVRYEPMKDADGKVIGMYFTGKPISEISSSRTNSIFVITIVTLLLSALSIFVFQRFAKKTITVPIQNMSEMAAKLARGDLSAADLTASSNDEIGLLAKSLQKMSETLRRYINDISQQLSVMARGDMTSDFATEYEGDFAPIRSAMQNISDSLNEVIGRISHSAQNVNSSASQVESGSKTLAQGATEQASTIQELSATTKEVSGKVEANSEKIWEMADVLTQAATGVSATSDKSASMLQAMTDLRESSGKIRQIVQSIDDIAFQTNILALNAAVEAAHAGEAGKGFAVVADEVRSLAAKSAEASKETAALIEDMLNRVQQGFSLAEESASSAQKINESLQNVMESMDTINSASSAQSTAVKQIDIGLENVSTVVQTNSATSEECAAASSELSQEAENLRGEVGKFHLRRQEKTAEQ